MKNLIECLDCGYTGEPGKDREGEDEIIYCPACESMYVAEVFSIREARQLAYNVTPIQCPSCKTVGEVDYNQGADYFSCAMCGKMFKGKGEAK